MAGTTYRWWIMSTSSNVTRLTPPVLNPRDVQIVTAHRRIKRLERALERVREDLEQRADIGTHDGDHSVQLSNSVYAMLCEVTDQYGEYEALKDKPLSLWQRVRKLSHWM